MLAASPAGQSTQIAPKTQERESFHPEEATCPAYLQGYNKPYFRANAQNWLKKTPHNTNTKTNQPHLAKMVNYQF